ncbi:MAG: zinc ribbon domain-containing protein [Planctomycetota bacterium]
MARRAPETFTCPNCGADVRVGALACPECGSDEDTGWSDDTMYDGLDLPDPDHDGSHPETSAARWKASVYGLAAVVLLVAFFWLLSRSGRLW